MNQASTLKIIFRCVALLYCMIIMQQTGAQDTTRFGAMINGDMSVPSKIAIINSLGAKYTRTAITLQNWSGADLAYEKYRDANINVALNINWYSHNLLGAPVPFPTNLVLYKNTLTAVLNKYPDPAIVVIENEETQKEYHSGPMNNYVAELYAAIPIVHGKGLKVTNGGIHPQGLCYWVWKDYIDRDLPDSAAWWKATTFSPQMNGGVTNPTASINFYWRQIDTLLRAYDTLDIDYVNMHYYEPINSAGDGMQVTGNAIKIIADYVLRRTGKRTMTNETGQENEDPVLVNNMLAAYATAKYPFVIWWSGDGNSARALNQSTGVLRENGNAYRSFVANYIDTLGKSVGSIGGGGDNSVTDPTIKPYEIIADRVDIKGRNGKKAELVIKNSTQNIKGFLYNLDSGLTKFKVGIDSMWFPGDTIKVRFTDGSVVSKVVTAAAGATTLQQAYDGSVTAGQTNPTVNTSAAGVYFRGTDVINRLGAQNGTDGTLSLVAADALNKRSYMSAGTTFLYVYPGYYKTNLPTGKGYAAVDVNGDGNITMQPLPTSFAEESSLQWSVLDSIVNPATYTGAIATGDKFLVAAGATGAFVNEDNHIAIYLNPGWNFDTAFTGDLLNNANVEGYATNSYVYKFTGSTWQRVSQNFVVNGGSPIAVKVGPKNANILQFITNNATRLSFAANGNARWPKLIGTGYRLTQVDANGYFTTIPWTTVRDSVGTTAAAITAGNFQATSTTKGISVSGSEIRLHAADDINPGALTTAAQSIGGVKTFTASSLKAPNLSTGSSADELVVWNASDGFRRITPQNFNLSYILNQYAAKQNAKAWIDSLRIDGKLRLDSLAGLNGLFIYGSARATNNRYSRVYWSDTSTLTWRIETEQGNLAKNLNIDLGTGVYTGTLRMKAGNIYIGNNGGYVEVPSLSINSDLSLSGRLYMQGNNKEIVASRLSDNIAGRSVKIIGQAAGTGGATNLAGGDLYLVSGVSKGNASSNIIFQTPPAGVSGDNTPTTKLTIDGNNVVVNTALSLSSPIISSGTSPSFVLGAGASSGDATASIDGNSVAGSITVNIGASPTSGADIITVNFATALSATPKAIILTPGNQPAAAQGNRYFINAAVTSNTSFSIRATNTGVPAGQTFKFYYHVIQ